MRRLNTVRDRRVEKERESVMKCDSETNLKDTQHMKTNPSGCRQRKYWERGKEAGKQREQEKE